MLVDSHDLQQAVLEAGVAQRMLDDIGIEGYGLQVVEEVPVKVEPAALQAKDFCVGGATGPDLS